MRHRHSELQVQHRVPPAARHHHRLARRLPPQGAHSEHSAGLVRAVRAQVHPGIVAQVLDFNQNTGAPG